MTVSSRYASAFDRLLTVGRRELAEMTGEAAPAGERGSADDGRPSDGSAQAGAVVEGTVRGIPFTLKVRT